MYSVGSTLGEKYFFSFEYHKFYFQVKCVCKHKKSITGFFPNPRIRIGILMNSFKKETRKVQSHGMRENY